MKYLFIHQNFPGQYLHLLRHLARDVGNEIVFISEDNPNAMAGVRRVLYRMPQADEGTGHAGARELERGLVRAAEVEKTARALRRLGFVPDIVIGHHGWGELLNMEDVFPGVPVLGYMEFFYHTQPGFDVDFDPEFPLAPQMLPVIRAKNAINLLALNAPGHGQTPTDFQKNTYPAWAGHKMTVLREGVDLTLCRPDPMAARRVFTLGGVRIAPGQKLVTYVARDLEPYRGFHVFMRALVRVLAERADTQVVIVGGDGVSYGAPLASGTWREIMLRELGSRLDRTRVHFAGKLAYADFIRLLQRSNVHVYLTYPFVASWSLREAMAMGCTIVGSATAPVEEFLDHGKTGLLVPFLDPHRIAEGVLNMLANPRLARRLGRGARQMAERTLCLRATLDAYERLIARLVAGTA
ncbi:glycosyltransferase [Acetobacter sp. TBRC 12305]|uniref:Glycosyltransferase n=1 Tax=Acetobacter garciniae TaxID=2817435 RepID=A0A939KQZ9_9PROT|nr:glycosyltransferase [Acetobacter garciniae]MBO1326082.1 glycosyltransferase [Acetobacter garciniae]MBX0345174.1 glycosyltransferase [Acetobacter garciniae]